MNKLIELLEVRKIMSLIIVGLFVILALKSKLDTQFIQTVIIAVISFYFGKATALDRPDKEE